MRVFLYDSRGGSINSEEINSDIGSGVNGEKLGAGYVQKCFSITLFMYKVTSNKNTHFFTDHTLPEITEDFIRRKVVITRLEQEYMLMNHHEVKCQNF